MTRHLSGGWAIVNEKASPCTPARGGSAAALLDARRSECENNLDCPQVYHRVFAQVLLVIRGMAPPAPHP